MHQGMTTYSFMSPDGKTLLTLGGTETGYTREARRWDIQGGNASSYHISLFSARMIESRSRRLTVPGKRDAWWREVTKKKVDAIIGKDGLSSELRDYKLSPDGAWLATSPPKPSGVLDHEIRLWNISEEPREGHVLSGYHHFLAFAFSPDGAYILSACYDLTFRVWDVAKGQEIAFFPLAGRYQGLTVHPWLPFAITGDNGGNVYLIDLHNIPYGPIVITARRAGNALQATCSRCQTAIPLTYQYLGQILSCPKCALSLRLNLFTEKR